jgi:short-subunit dehydrogenase
MEPHCYPNVLVTGASRGLGAALARILVERGYRVMLSGRDAPALERLAAALNPAGSRTVRWAAADLTDPDAATQLVAAAESGLGQIDALVNNAGFGAYRPLTEWSAREIVDCVAVNLTAPMLLARAVLPGMKARGHGIIVNIASDLARRYQANMAPYVATKFGLLGFSGSLLREAKVHGIKAVTVMPGIIDTAFGGGAEGTRDAAWALRPADLAARIVDVMELPEEVIVDEITVHPLRQDPY